MLSAFPRITCSLMVFVSSKWYYRQPSRNERGSDVFLFSQFNLVGVILYHFNNGSPIHGDRHYISLQKRLGPHHCQLRKSAVVLLVTVIGLINKLYVDLDIFGPDPQSSFRISLSEISLDELIRSVSIYRPIGELLYRVYSRL